jgi:hypothetical protein
VGNLAEFHPDRVRYPELIAATHWKIARPFAQDCKDFPEQVDILAQAIAAQVQSVTSNISPELCDYFITTTCLPGNIGVPERNLVSFFDVIGRLGGVRPHALIQAYMCAGWGYGLQFFARNCVAKYLLLTIADVDPHDLKIHLFHPAIGKQGFGVTTLLFDLSKNRGGPIISGPIPKGVFQEFVRSLRDYCTEVKPDRIFLPYLREDLVRIARSAVSAIAVGPNLADEYFHCFGSDPWIGLMEWIRESGPTDATVAATAVAFNGYYTIGTLQVTKSTAVDLRKSAGDKASLLHMISEVSARAPRKLLHTVAK